MLKDNWPVFKNVDKLSEQLANDILEIAKLSIKPNNRFKIALTGGNSVISLYKILKNSDSDLSKWHIYLGGEHCFPAKRKDRNDHIINQVWLNNHQNS